MTAVDERIGHFAQEVLRGRVPQRLHERIIALSSDLERVLTMSAAHLRAWCRSFTHARTLHSMLDVVAALHLLQRMASWPRGTDGLVVWSVSTATPFQVALVAAAAGEDVESSFGTSLDAATARAWEDRARARELIGIKAAAPHSPSPPSERPEIAIREPRDEAHRSTSTAAAAAAASIAHSTASAKSASTHYLSTPSEVAVARALRPPTLSTPSTAASSTSHQHQHSQHHVRRSAAAAHSVVRRAIDAALRTPLPTLPPAHPLSGLVYAMEGVRAAAAEAGADWRDIFSDERWVQLRDVVAEGLQAVGIGVDVLLSTARSPPESWETLAVRLASAVQSSGSRIT